MKIDQHVVSEAMLVANKLGFEGTKIIGVAYQIKPVIEGAGFIPARLRYENNDHIYFTLEEKEGEKKDDKSK